MRTSTERSGKFRARLVLQNTKMNRNHEGAEEIEKDHVKKKKKKKKPIANTILSDERWKHFPLISGMTKMSVLATFIQYCNGGSSQDN